MGLFVLNAVTTGRIGRVSAVPFVVTSFMGAALIFLVQPMFARMATPLLGGAPAVWNVSLVCFQAALLAGYAYAHALSRLKSGRIQLIIHACVLLVGFACLPLHMSDAMGEPDANNPVWWLIGTFVISIAPPFAALSATAPLIQHWYARSGLSDAADPYHLYAASNLGSLLGLAAYPLVVEPFARLTEQTSFWTLGYAALALCLLYAGWTVSRAGIGDASEASRPAEAAQALTWRERLMWLALAFAPSSLLVGVTSHITTDVAAAPFLWAPPLIIYLLTFVIAFSRKPLVPHSIALMTAPLAAALVALSLSGVMPKSLPLAMGADLFALFAIALACHGALTARRPHASHLTQFYLIMSLGGVLGGAFNALLAPVIFDSVIEYPLMLIVSLGLLGVGAPRPARMTMIFLAIAAVALLAAAGFKIANAPVSPLLQLVLVVPGFAAIIMSRRTPAGAAAALAMATPIAFMFQPMTTVSSERSFFGVVSVVDSPADNARYMLHGTTIHGSQSLTGDRLEARSYYSKGSPIGQAIQTFREAERVGIVGLGIGGVACYARPGQAWTFFEIDPLVVDVALDSSRFTFMSECQPNAPILIGDARLKLAAMQGQTYDILLLDAFSSDSVPVHLVTREAMKIYFDRVGRDGVLIYNVSNRHIDLRPVLARTAATFGAATLTRRHFPSDEQKKRGVSPSEVVVVSLNSEAIERLRETGDWQSLSSDGGRPWTDDYSNVVGAMLAKARQK